MKHAVRISLILFMMLIMGCKGGSGGDSTSAKGTTPTIHILGDNISTKNGVTMNWVDVLQASTAKVIKNNAVYRAAAVPNTCNNALDGNNSKLSPVNAGDVLIIFTGQEDVRWSGWPVAPDCLGTYFPQTFERAALLNIKIYIVTPPKTNATIYASFSPLNHGSDAATLSYRNALITMNSTYSSYVHSQIIDLYSSFNPIVGNLQADKQYPNETGQAIIGQIIRDALSADGAL